MLFLFLAITTSSAANAQSELPKGKITESARSAYNQGDFNKAVSLFLELSYQHGEHPAVLRALAASANNAKKDAVAVLAYEAYLSTNLSREQAQKASAELKNVKKRMSKASRDTLKKRRKLSVKLRDHYRRGQVRGTDGLMEALVKFFNASGFDPKVKKYLQACSESIEEMVDENIQRFWQVDTRLDGDALIELSQTLETAKGLRKRLPNWVIWTQTLSVLELYFDQNYSTALKTFEGSQLSDFRLRYMLALLLHKNKRYDESIALIRSLGAHQDDIKFQVLQNLWQLQARKKSSDEDLDILMEVLDNLPVDHLRSPTPSPMKDEG